jgi:NAD(P)-dependent dehydrogenase (short-subunit alcohol dehydrogenase family)
MSEQDFQGKVCVITGGTQGVGEATARHFASNGAAGIVICGRNSARGASVRNSLEATGAPAVFVQARLESESECESVIAAADRQFGRVDVLVNAGGTTKRGSIVDSTAKDIDEVFAINVRGPMVLMREAIALMRRNGNGGSIVNVSSVVATGGPDFLAAYSASKAALNAVTRNAAYAVVRDRIRVNGIGPGWIDTPGEHATRLDHHREDAGWLERAEAMQPFGRLIKVDELARAIAFLAGPQSGLMTGSIVHFDQSIPGAGDPPMPPG